MTIVNKEDSKEIDSIKPKSFKRIPITEVTMLQNKIDNQRKLIESLEHNYKSSERRVEILREALFPTLPGGQKILLTKEELDEAKKCREDAFFDLSQKKSIIADEILGPLEIVDDKKSQFQNVQELTDIDFKTLAEKLEVIAEKKENTKMTQPQFINESNLEFTDISSEQYRIYEFNNGKTIMIVEPLRLNVSKNGGHRVYDNSGISHYIPQGWIHLHWRSKPGKPNFVK